jgi:catechol 2,3-dioxygenase-like lactoylglutathione lyase family enzyme/transcriptional regulator with XRE-family HTH domain
MAMPSNEQHQELGCFLRTRRQALQPEDVALVAGARRRRTPGLRREEVAELAGIGVSWYTRLEQGKDVQLSPRALRGVAEALRLTPAQREYVFALARGETLGVEPAPVRTVTPTLQDILDAQGANPAYITDGRFDLLGWNQAALDIFGVFGRALPDIPPEERNVVWLIFTDGSRQRLLDWEQHAQRVLAQFRDASRYFVDDPWFPAFVDRLQRRSPEFAAWWPRHDVGRVQATAWIRLPAVAGSGAASVGGRACGWGRHTSTVRQIPPPWAWWENEAPATRAARRPVPGDQTGQESRSAAPRAAASMTVMDLTIHTTFLPHDDPEASLAFWRDTLGFEVRSDVGNGKMRWITVGPADQPGTSILLAPPAADPGITDDERRTIAEMMAKGTYGWILLATADLDGVFARLEASDAEVVQEPIQQPYGVRDCAFRDPAGNLIRIQEQR